MYLTDITEIHRRSLFKGKSLGRRIAIGKKHKYQELGTRNIIVNSIIFNSEYLIYENPNGLEVRKVLSLR